MVQAGEPGRRKGRPQGKQLPSGCNTRFVRCSKRASHEITACGFPTVSNVGRSRSRRPGRATRERLHGEFRVSEDPESELVFIGGTGCADGVPHPALVAKRPDRKCIFFFACRGRATSPTPTAAGTLRRSTPASRSSTPSPTSRRGSPGMDPRASCTSGSSGSTSRRRNAGSSSRAPPPSIEAAMRVLREKRILIEEETFCDKFERPRSPRLLDRGGLGSRLGGIHPDPARGASARRPRGDARPEAPLLRVLRQVSLGCERAAAPRDGGRFHRAPAEAGRGDCPRHGRARRGRSLRPFREDGGVVLAGGDDAPAAPRCPRSSGDLEHDRGGRFVSVIRDLASGETRILPLPIYALSPDGHCAVSPEFARIHRTRPGYGYLGVPEIAPDDPAPAARGWQRP